MARLGRMIILRSREDPEEEEKPSSCQRVSFLRDVTGARKEDYRDWENVKFEGQYTHDYNILNIHDAIVRKLENEKTDKLDFQLLQLRDKIQKPQSLGDRMKDLAAIRRLEKDIEKIRKRDKLVEYLQESSPLIQKYQELGVFCQKISFGTQEETTLTEEQRERLAVISSYITVAQKYIPCSLIWVWKEPPRCQSCGSEIVPSTVLADVIQSCEKCGCSIPIRSSPESTKENARISISPKENIINGENFRKVIRRFEGLQNVHLPPKMFEDLDRHFLSRGQPHHTSAAVKAMPLKENRRRGDTDHSMLFDALSATGYTDFYEDVNLIGSKYWGWELPSLRELEPILMDHFSKTERVFKNLKCNRSSSISTQLRLYLHLRNLGFPCEQGEFKIPAGDSVREQMELWRQMCEGAGDPAIQYVPL